MAYAEHDAGDIVEVKAEFTDENGNPKDPTGLTLVVHKPDGTEDSYVLSDLTRVSTGVYTFDVDTTAVDNSGYGVWYYRFQATGAVQQAGESGFKVKYSRVLS